MDPHLRHAIESAVADATGSPARITGARPVGGGSINDTCLVTFDDGRRAFVKTNDAPLPHMFEREAEGLEALVAADIIPVPRPLGTGTEPLPFLVMEAVDVGSPAADFHERFGRSLAALHRTARSERHGFDHDNYLGATPQPNDWHDRWADFWRQHRLGHQIGLARQRGLSDRELDRLADRLLDRLDDFLDPVNDAPSLLHGDLWGGNYLVGADGHAVLVDPACYYGHREADLAMTRLFGGFQPAFYRAYEEAWPLDDGAAERAAIYELHHLLNHLNLFGRSYRSGCLARLRRVVG